MTLRTILPLPLETAANQQRRQQLQEAQERVAKLRVGDCRLLGAGGVVQLWHAYIQ